jgi:hypothetical protein
MILKIGQLNSLRCANRYRGRDGNNLYFDTDFGPNYIRNLGANDYTSGGTSFNGSGNDFPMMGTGNTVFFNWVTCSRKIF